MQDFLMGNDLELRDVVLDGLTIPMNKKYKEEVTTSTTRKEYNKEDIGLLRKISRPKRS